MEVTGVVTAAISTADVVARLCLCLAQFESDRRHAGSRVETLHRQLRNLYNVVGNVRYCLDARAGGDQSPASDDDLLQNMKDTLSDCRDTMRKFEQELTAIHGPQQFEKLKNSLLKSTLVTLKLKSKSGLVDRFEREIAGYLTNVQLQFSCLQE
jgi:leucyl-tRNA synthetase